MWRNGAASACVAIPRTPKVGVWEIFNGASIPQMSPFLHSMGSLPWLGLHPILHHAFHQTRRMQLQPTTPPGNTGQDQQSRIKASRGSGAAHMLLCTHQYGCACGQLGGEAPVHNSGHHPTRSSTSP